MLSIVCMLPELSRMKRMFGLSEPEEFGVDNKSSVSSARIEVPLIIVSASPAHIPLNGLLGILKLSGFAK